MAKRGHIHSYRTYLFRDKDPAIDKVRTIIEQEEMSYKDIHEASDVAVGTMSNWFHGKTRKPQHATLAAVAGALGYDWTLTKKRPRR